MRTHPFGTRECEIKVDGIPCLARFTVLPSEPSVGIMGEEIEEVALYKQGRHAERMGWLEKKIAGQWDDVIATLFDRRHEWAG